MLSENQNHNNSMQQERGAKAVGVLRFHSGQALRPACASCTQKFRRNFGYFGSGNRLPFGLAISRGAHPAIFSKKISKFFTKGGQQVIEYVLVITAISAALTAMYVYTKRGLQSVIKSTVDAEIGPQIDSGAVVQAGDSQSATSVSITASRDNSRYTVTAGGGRQSVFDSASASTGSGTTVSGAFKGERHKECIYPYIC